MVPPHPAKTKKVPGALKLVIAFFFALCALQAAIVLRACVATEEPGREFLLDVLLRGLLSLLALLTAVQLLLRLPFARVGAAIILVGFTAVTAFHYVVFPLRWQVLDLPGRLQQFAGATILLAMAGLLLSGSVVAYFAHEKESPPAPPPPPGGGDTPPDPHKTS
jgi:hypothetical protein